MDLNREQIESLEKSLRPTLGYLHRLRDRMEKTGAIPSDPLHQHVSKALDAMQGLCVELH